MAKYRSRLPQLADQLFLTDGGLETTLVFHEGIDLPCFAALDLLKDASGAELLMAYYAHYATIALANGHGFILESPTWRASADWGTKLGYSMQAIRDVNRRSIVLMEELRRQFETPQTPIVVSGQLGPRGDGYDPGKIMSAGEAQSYHADQVAAFTEAGADMVAAITMTNVNEAIGIARAAKEAKIPSAISFTLETDGKLPTGQDLGDAIADVDRASGNAPAYYMINCARPTHFDGTLAGAGKWVTRIRGIRANASTRSHAELDQAAELDAGDPAELGRQYRDLRRKYPHFTVLGGCCGTDHRHVEHITMACKAAV